MTINELVASDARQPRSPFDDLLCSPAVHRQQRSRERFGRQITSIVRASGPPPDKCEDSDAMAREEHVESLGIARTRRPASRLLSDHGP